MTNSVRFTLGDGDPTWAVYNWNIARQIELVTLNTTLSVFAMVK